MGTLSKDQIQTAYMQASARYADLNNKATVGLVDHNLTKDDYNKIIQDRDQAKMERDGLLDQLKNWDTNHPGAGKPTESKATNLKNTHKTKEEVAAEARKRINDFVHAGRFLNAGDTSTTGVTRPTVSPTIPEQIIYNPSAEVDSVVDLSTLITKTPVVTGSGTYPVLKRADDAFKTVDELKENPEMALPEFTNVNWKVDTYRGAIPISQEAIDDSAVDVSGIVTRQIGERKVNTTNAAISDKLKQFSAATANRDNLVDAFKWLINVGLDPAYHPTIVVTQSLYNALDTLKDAQGRYIFHQDMTSKSGDTLLGLPVKRVGDTLLGQAGDAKAFIGDLGRGLFFADRKNINMMWQWDNIFGWYLAGALRFGISMADANAGYFLSADIPTQDIIKPTVEVKKNPDEDKKQETPPTGN